jgi:hypothetical protein
MSLVIIDACTLKKRRPTMQSRDVLPRLLGDAARALRDT